MQLNEVHNEQEHASVSLKVILLVFAIILVGALGYLVWDAKNIQDTTDYSTPVVTKTVETTPEATTGTEIPKKDEVTKNIINYDNNFWGNNAKVIPLSFELPAGYGVSINSSCEGACIAKYQVGIFTNSLLDLRLKDTALYINITVIEPGIEKSVDEYISSRKYGYKKDSSIEIGGINSSTYSDIGLTASYHIIFIYKEQLHHITATSTNELDKIKKDSILSQIISTWNFK